MYSFESNESPVINLQLRILCIKESEKLIKERKELIQEGKPTEETEAKTKHMPCSSMPLPDRELARQTMDYASWL